MTIRWRQFGHSWDRTEANRDAVRAVCAPILLSADELANAVKEDGVDAWAAKAFVENLIERARLAGVARTLGVPEQSNPVVDTG